VREFVDCEYVEMSAAQRAPLKRVGESVGDGHGAPQEKKKKEEKKEKKGDPLCSLQSWLPAVSAAAATGGTEPSECPPPAELLGQCIYYKRRSNDDDVMEWHGGVVKKKYKTKPGLYSCALDDGTAVVLLFENSKRGNIWRIVEKAKPSDVPVRDEQVGTADDAARVEDCFRPSHRTPDAPSPEREPVGFDGAAMDTVDLTIEDEREPCSYGADCHRMDASHRAQFSHPPDDGGGGRGGGAASACEQEDHLGGGAGSAESAYEAEEHRCAAEELDSEEDGEIDEVFGEGTLTPQQQHIFDVVVTHGRSVFFSGAAGTGKSHLLRAIVAGLRAQDKASVYVCGATGVAACNVGGTTLHSFSGFGQGKGSSREMASAAQRSRYAAQRWRKCKTLVIDEISMIDARTFTAVHLAGQHIRKAHEDTLCGGLQLVLCGDFFQLPPVAASGSAAARHEGEGRFCFESPAWRLLDEVHILERVFRQANPRFAQMLNSLRFGDISETDLRALQATENNRFDTLQPTKLFAVNSGVDSHNKRELCKLAAEGKQVYHARDTGSAFLLNQMKRHCKAPEMLELRVGAAVMLLKNLDCKQGLVNGSRGVVVRFKQQHNATTALDDDDSSFLRQFSKPQRGAAERDVAYPVVRFEVKRKSNAAKSHREVVITREEWNVEQEADEARRSQLPLTLAWALSIHKSQGMTIAPLEVDLRSCFEVGQAYVALSRATDLTQLRVVGFRRNQIRASPEVRRFYDTLASADHDDFQRTATPKLAEMPKQSAAQWTTKKNKRPSPAPRDDAASSITAADDLFFAVDDSVERRDDKERQNQQQDEYQRNFLLRQQQQQQQQQQQRQPPPLAQQPQVQKQESRLTAAQIRRVAANREEALRRLEASRLASKRAPPAATADVLVPLKKKAAKQWTDGPYRPHWMRQ